MMVRTSQHDSDDDTIVVTSDDESQQQPRRKSSKATTVMAAAQSSSSSSSSSSSRGHDLMKRLCLLNPQFANSVLEDYIRPLVRDEDVVLEIECGANSALLYLSRLCQGSKGPCIWFQDSWLTPNEFQYISGRETAKDWKRSIRHCGKSMKLLLTKGILTTHPPICDCDGCRISSPVNRVRLSDIRRPEDRDGAFGHHDHHHQEQPRIDESSSRSLQNMLNSPPRPPKMRLTSVLDNLRDLRNKANLVNVNNNNYHNNNNNNQDFFKMQKSRKDERPLRIFKQENQHPMPQSMADRQYSDFIRGLAAKYNFSDPKSTTMPTTIPFGSGLSGNPFLGLPGLLRPPSVSVSSSQPQMPFLPHFLLSHQQPQQPLMDLTGTNALLSLMRTAQEQRAATDQESRKRKAESSEPDIAKEAKKVAEEDEKSDRESQCQRQGQPCNAKAKAVSGWSVNDVCQFVESIELCKPYVETFRSQNIDGGALLLLDERHLADKLGMKLGPIIKLRQALAKRISACPKCFHCNGCHTQKDIDEHNHNINEDEDDEELEVTH